MASIREQFNLGNIVAILGLLLTMGVGNWTVSNFESFVADAALTSKKFHLAVDSVARVRVDSLINAGVGNRMMQDILEELTDGDREKVLQELKSNNEFANKLREGLGDMRPEDLAENHKKLAKFLKEDKMKLPECDKILSKDGRPYLYIPCEGAALPIRYGRPSRTDGKRYRYEIYYIMKDGVEYPLNRISNVLLDG